MNEVRAYKQQIWLDHSKAATELTNATTGSWQHRRRKPTTIEVFR